MPDDTSPGRREANKARTRRAVIDAVYRLIADHPLEDLTAEQVAEAADISRRTFFNYFPSVEAVLAHREHEVLDQLRTALNARPAEESLVDSLHAVVADLFTVEMLAEATSVWRASDGSPAAARYALAAKDETLAEIGHDWATRRGCPTGEEPDPLRAAVMTAAGMAAFDVARRAWLADHDGAMDAAAREDFLTRVHRAFDYLRPALDTPSTTTPEHHPREERAN